MAADRETARDALATLLTAALVGSGKPAQAVYNYRKGEWSGLFPVVEVSSRTSTRTQMTRAGSRATFGLQVDVYVLYALDDGTWTEALAEDALDEIEHLIAGAVEQNQTTAPWKSLSYAGNSERMDVTIGGVPYIWETIPLVAEVYE